MVGGLERFRDHFKEHAHQYALIGGSACDLLMEQVGLTFRATKDLDIVLIVEELDSGFARSFWEFIRAGRYAVAQSSEGKPTYLLQVCLAPDLGVPEHAGSALDPA